MHILQQKILELSHSENISKLTLREIGVKVGDKYPQKIKHHIDQLYKKGFIKQSADGSVVSPTNKMGNESFFSIPLLGSANCGKAVTFAEEHLEGYLTISKRMLNLNTVDNLFAIKAVGSSMNRASIQGEKIEDNDYVLIDSTQRDLHFYEDKYVLSIINGMANIKKLKVDEDRQVIILLSESSEDYPPIYIHQEDFHSYMINGLVSKVIKKP